MNDIVFKVAPHGEGKTKWLLSIAKHYADERRSVYLFTTDDNEYLKFCEKYFNVFKEVCPVMRVTGYNVSHNDIVLVDNLFNHAESAIGDYTFMNKNCYKMFVTIEGTTTFKMNKRSMNEFYEELALDIQEVIRA